MMQTQLVPNVITNNIAGGLNGIDTTKQLFQEMKISLFHLFSQVGEVIEINLRTSNQSNKLRGQAFIVFREQDMADRGLQELRGFTLFGKQMEIQYAKSQSDTTLKNKGQYDDSIRLNRRQKRKAKDDLKRMDKREKLLLTEQSLKQQLNLKEQILKQSNSLLLENLPQNYNQLLLQELLKNYPGLQEYQLDAQKGRAVVNFHTSNDAKVALSGLNKYQIDHEGRELKASFTA
ncbi:UNKNOWN [Stylonychia lemnae]|uniref:RRM domain-containing protein n=1 Tax=Stylonychia lemnae TaxID=5949 RepID=A0A078AFG5_STYLE|nr:UNKNOWN [Stylonychia lemnae]|eukprot:CDW80925.1 UNKNOWN [Stylonychia lemnae]